MRDVMAVLAVIVLTVVALVLLVTCAPTLDAVVHYQHKPPVYQSKP